MKRSRLLFWIFCLLSFATAATAQYQARWDQVGGTWTTGWVDGPGAYCIHGTSCNCGGNFCGRYGNGATTTAWPYGCTRPQITWQLQCTVRKAQKFRARWDQIGGSWTTGWVYGDDPACTHGISCACGGANYCGRYGNGATTTAWPYGCGRPQITWPLRCTVEAVTAAPQSTPVPQAMMTPPPRAQAFSNPVIGGYYVDRCLNFAANCDQPAADAFCRTQGYSRANSFHWSYKFPTRVMQGGQICNTGSCGAFDSVVCEGGQQMPAQALYATPARQAVYTRPAQPAYRPPVYARPARPAPPPAHQSGGVIVDTPQN